MALELIVNPNKLDELPKDVQAMLLTPKPLQLITLLAALSWSVHTMRTFVSVRYSLTCSHDHLDFLRLPIEIREMIYFHLVVPSSGCIGHFYPLVSKSDQYYSHSWRNHPHPGSEYPLPCLPTFRACSSIYAEAQETMFENTAYRNDIVDISNAISFERDIFAIGGFRKLSLKVQLHSSTLERFVAAAVSVLTNRKSEAPVDFDLDLHAIEEQYWWIWILYPGDLSDIKHEGDIFDPSRRWPLDNQRTFEQATKSISTLRI